eukprot:CAMPEP_0184497080 /NCGR_PEP_ID=MMETSP0113_2-20130426/35630_1 /TAXON_ID=91329 /ORGANISM="Norrisiella sphaerica, Strain BC52" /LENGTH=89 /DNA_ID=CAMNT_0026884033 /DNA_START=504 /DNA_END=773 /DNA_ORIENTATION=-
MCGGGVMLCRWRLNRRGDEGGACFSSRPCCPDPLPGLAPGKAEECLRREKISEAWVEFDVGEGKNVEDSSAAFVWLALPFGSPLRECPC